jgi:hypothetical protein
MSFAYQILVGKPEGSRSFEWGLSLGRRIILKLILKIKDAGVWTGFNWLRIATTSGPFCTNLRVP